MNMPKDQAKQSIELPARYDHSKVLLADDEPEHSDWLVDYLKSKGCETVVTTNVKDTIEAVQSVAFRIYLIDLNIPLGGWAPTVRTQSSTYDDYHGLYILKLVRSQGNSGDRVIAYSAHENEAIHAEMKRLYCRYVVKGRPGEFKKEIDELLKRRPPRRPPLKRLQRAKPAAKPRGRRVSAQRAQRRR